MSQIPSQAVLLDPLTPLAATNTTQGVTNLNEAAQRASFESQNDARIAAELQMAENRLLAESEEAEASRDFAREGMAQDASQFEATQATAQRGQDFQRELAQDQLQFEKTQAEKVEAIRQQERNTRLRLLNLQTELSAESEAEAQTLAIDGDRLMGEMMAIQSQLPMLGTEVSLEQQKFLNDTMTTLLQGQQLESEKGKNLATAALKGFDDKITKAKPPLDHVQGALSQVGNFFDYATTSDTGVGTAFNEFRKDVTETSRRTASPGYQADYMAKFGSKGFSTALAQMIPDDEDGPEASMKKRAAFSSAVSSLMEYGNLAGRASTDPGLMDAAAAYKKATLVPALQALQEAGVSGSQFNAMVGEISTWASHKLGMVRGHLGQDTTVLSDEQKKAAKDQFGETPAEALNQLSHQMQLAARMGNALKLVTSDPENAATLPGLQIVSETQFQSYAGSLHKLLSKKYSPEEATRIMEVSGIPAVVQKKAIKVYEKMKTTKGAEFEAANSKLRQQQEDFRRMTLQNTNKQRAIARKFAEGARTLETSPDAGLVETGSPLPQGSPYDEPFLE